MDYSSFVQKGEDGSIQSFDEAKMASFIDSQISKGVETFKAKFEKDQARANMNEQEKFSEQLKEFEQARAEFEASMKAQKTELVVEKAKARLKGANFSDTEIAVLTKYVTDDEKESLKMVDSLVTERQRIFDENKKKIIEEIQANQPKTGTQSNSQSKEDLKTEVKKRTSEEIKNLYK